MSLFNELRIDRSALSFGTLADEGDDREFWRHKTPQERWDAIEFCRQVAYGYDPDTSRLQRVFEIVKPPWG